MNEEDRKAFEEWISGPPYERSVDRYPNDPTRYGFPGTYREHDVDLCKFAWLAARDHYRKQVAELVNVVDRIYKRHLAPLANQEGQSTLRLNLNDLDDALDQLKP